MFGKTLASRQKDLIRWAKKNRVDLPHNPEELSKVTVLDIGHRGLTKIPKEIDCVPNLEELVACNNKIKELPWEFAHLKKLRVLDLSFNKFYDVMGVICQLPALELLNLEGNLIKKLSPVIANLVNLKDLNLFFTNLNELPQEIGSLRHLTKINLAANSLTSLPSSFSKLYNLVDIEIWMNNFDKFPEVLKTLPNMKKLEYEYDNNKLSHKLMVAAMYDHVLMAEKLIDKGADVNFKLSDFDESSFTTPLFESRSLEMVKLLISKGADPNMQREIEGTGKFLFWKTSKLVMRKETFFSKNHAPEIKKYLETIKK
jgi:hypothetical protein